MALLPVPAQQYFDDFAFDLVEYKIFRNSKVICAAKGLTNSDKNGKYVSFLIGTDVQVGDVLQYDGGLLTVIGLSFDDYEGENQLVNAYYC